MASKAEFLAKIKEAKDKILALQVERANGGLSKMEEDEVKAALDDLSVTADPAVPNPAGTPPDPNQP